MNEVNEPLRLLRQRGHWTLEVTKLVAVDRHVLRPERRAVKGAESVVRHLKERCHPSSVREALDLIVGDDDGSDRAFELEGEHWIQLSAPEAEANGGHAKLLALVHELRAELTTMRALHEALRGRMSALERRSHQLVLPDYGRAAPRGAASVRPTRAKSLIPATQAAELLPFVAPSDERTQSGAGQPLATAATEHSAAAVRPTPLPVAKPLLALPLHADIVTCLKQLLGADPELQVERGNLPKELDGYYVSRVVDSADVELGALLLDRRGGVELAGRLLGFPPATLAEQANSEPSSDILDAMNEVVNNLGGFINRANPELRSRVRPLETFSSDAHGWLPKNAARIGVATKMAGHLWLVTR